jgi:hypothetical protein
MFKLLMEVRGCAGVADCEMVGVEYCSGPTLELVGEDGAYGTMLGPERCQWVQRAQSKAES